MRDLSNERRVISGMIHDEATCINAIAQLVDSDFTDAFHQDVFNLLTSMAARNIKPDYVKLLREGMKLGLLVKDGDGDRLKHISEHYITGHDGQYYISAVMQESKTRKLETVISRYTAALTDGIADIDNTLAEMVQELSGIHAGVGSDQFDGPADLADTLQRLVDEKEARFAAESVNGSIVLEGLPTGFESLDIATLGYKPGDMILLAAQTGHGKSAFSLQTARNIAVDIKRPVLYVNTEMSREMVIQRIASNIAEVPFTFMRQGNFTGNGGQDRQAITRAIKSVRQSKLIHRFAPNLTPARCAVLARQAKVQFGIEFMIIDYIGRMEKLLPGQSEWQVLEQIAKSMKMLAQELEIPVLILAQLNEDGTLQGAKRIKNECDLMLKLIPLTKEQMEGKYAESHYNANYRLWIDKNRDGAGGKNIALHFDMEIQKIVPAKARPKDDPPDMSQWEKLGRVVNP